VSPDPATADAPRRPALRVVSGDATPEEVAAILAVVAARAGGTPAPDDDGTARTWSAHGYAHRNVRGSFSSGRHGWKTSYWPR
jgi:Acyl-CoA carboxylase epsilon subunit